MRSQTVFDRDGFLAGIDHFADPRLVSLRSAAGMAALSLLAHGETNVAGYDMHDVAAIAALSVQRFLTTGIGEFGAPIGHTAHEEMLEVVVPFVLAWQAVTGQNLAVDTGLERTGAWLR